MVYSTLRGDSWLLPKRLHHRRARIFGIRRHLKRIGGLLPQILRRLQKGNSYRPAPIKGTGRLNYWGSPKLRTSVQERSPLDQDECLASPHLRNSAMALTTVCCSSSRSSGKMGRARTSRAARSASGKLPSL